MIAVAFVATLIAVACALVAIMTGAARRAGGSFPAKAMVVVGGWLAVTGLVTAAGLTKLDGGPPRVLALPIIAIAVGLVALRSKTGRALIAAASPAQVIALQAFRLPVELVLWRLFLGGVMPVQMTFEGRNFDVLVGLRAIPVAILAARRASPRLVLAWHALGLVLLANIVVVAILSVPGPLRAFWNEPANTVVGSLPYVWLPAFLVPIALLGHVVGIRQALAACRPEAAPRVVDGSVTR